MKRVNFVFSIRSSHFRQWKNCQSNEYVTGTNPIANWHLIQVEMVVHNDRRAMSENEHFHYKRNARHVRAVSCDWTEQPACSHASIFVAVTPHFFSFVPCWTRHYTEIIPLIVVVRAFIPDFMYFRQRCVCHWVKITNSFFFSILHFNSIGQPFYHLQLSNRFQWKRIKKKLQKWKVIICFVIWWRKCFCVGRQTHDRNRKKKKTNML